MDKKLDLSGAMDQQTIPHSSFNENHLPDGTHTRQASYSYMVHLTLANGPYRGGDSDRDYQNTCATKRDLTVRQD